MTTRFNPLRNHQRTRKEIGYVPLKQAVAKDWKRIGFKSGLEVHQQLDTKLKLFCRCPAGKYHDDLDYDGELIRHMRPTLSEMGEYDGTALMEFKTKKEIIYRINNESACTYEIDDTPPFKINPEALEYALEISLASKQNIVGEVHISRKQYLDGSIPTGFQRTAILGVEGEIELSNKKVRLIQLSLEEDSCREISDIGHTRIYKTDRLGMPLTETVTYPDMETPYELREAAEYIRFLNRSTGRVRTGIGSAREDVNVSCKGGSRVEIKGVSHNKWIPRLSHNEAFRQYALLNIRKLLLERFPDDTGWEISSFEIYPEKIGSSFEPFIRKHKTNYQIWGVNLPGFKGLLSHFTQPGKCFFDEIENRLKVIACLNRPNAISSEPLTPDEETQPLFKHVRKHLKTGEEDAQIIFWGPASDIPTALETIQERCLLAFKGVPNETRKPLANGTTEFERVLPGADRMYPDTDSAPIPLSEEYIDELKKRIPVSVTDRIRQFRKWGIPEDTFTYLLKNNLAPLIEQIADDPGLDPKWIATFLGHTLKHLEGQKSFHPDFNYNQLPRLFQFLVKQGLDKALAYPMISVMIEYPNMDFTSILTSIKFKKRTVNELLAPVSFLIEKFREIHHTTDPGALTNWLMGQLRAQATGNIPLDEFNGMIREQVQREFSKTTR
ncbi:MAG: Glu-tRNA(Gln) amidotransferase subunit GatE [Bacteroidales bacterium]|nr:Glu-tRNA(Gln) amidotransferase subunit GatE [Bacteroidales bacterium]